MSETNQSRRLPRRIGAVLAGLLVVVLLDVGIDVVMHQTGIYPPWFQPMRTSLWLLAIAYRTCDGILGGYVVGWLAPDRPVKHALVLGLIGLGLSTLGAVATWGKGPEFGPRWYPVALAVLAVPNALIGGFLRQMQLRRRVEN